MKILARWQVLDCRTDPSSVYHLQVSERKGKVILEREEITTIPHEPEGEARRIHGAHPAIIDQVIPPGRLPYLQRPILERPMMLVQAERFIEGLERRFCFVFSVDVVKKT